MRRRAGEALGIVLATACYAAMSSPASAEEKPQGPPTGVPSPSIATSLPPMLADPGGLRAALAAKGVTFQINYIGEVLSSASGGMRKGTIYDGRLELVIDADLEKLLGWSGAAIHANGYDIHGRSMSADNIGNFLFASNIEAVASPRLYEAWFEQKFADGKVGLRFGQLAADTEFLTSTYAALFINSTFGWPDSLAVNLPSGGPAYPLATPGIRVRYDPGPQYSLLLGIFNGDPAGPGLGNPQDRDLYGVNFRLQDPPFVIAEGQYRYNQDSNSQGLPGTIKLGAWGHFGQFDDLGLSTNGFSLADPRSNGMPLLYRGNYGVYGVLNQQVYRLPGDDPTKGVGIFTRLMASPSDRNLADVYIDGGVNFSGLIAARPDDSFGVAAAFLHISDVAGQLSQNQAFFLGTPVPLRDYEAAIEVTYQAQIIPGWSLQPDFQYIMHPAGNVLNPLAAVPVPIHNAVVVGLRTTINY